jgi:hypothetical protein
MAILAIMKLTRRYLAVLALALALGGSSRQTKAQDWTQRFQNDAPKNWAEYANLAKRIQGSCVKTYTNRKTRELYGIERVECKQSNASVWTILEKLGPKEFSSLLFATTPTYAFQLTRHDANSAWVIAAIDSPAKDVAGPGIPREMAFHSICPGLMVGPTWLPNLVKDPDFRITSATGIDPQDQRLVRIDYSFTPAGEHHEITRSGFAILDSQHYWLVNEYEVAADDGHGGKGKFGGVVEYSTGPGEIPLATHCKFRRWGVNAKSEPVDYDDIRDFDLVLRDVPEDAFLLSALGLPEPPTEPRNSHLFLVLAGVGIGCLCTAVAIRTLLRRRSQFRSA